MQRTVPSVAAAIVALAPLLAPDRAAAEEEVLVKAPSFHAEDMNGGPVVLEDILGKGPIVVDFWATWCKPCIKELPHIQRLHDEYSAKGVTVLAVTIDSPKSQSRVKPFVTGRGFTFTVVMDGSQDVFRKMQGKGSIPYVVVLDADGNIRYRHTGYRPGDENELEKIVRELLGEPAEEPAAQEAPEESTG
jgi:peroxiredoxin